MTDAHLIKFSIEPTWEIVKDINKRIVDILPTDDKNVINSIRLTVTELIENAVKYGEKTPNCQGIDFELRVNSNKVTINVTNGVKADSNINNVLSRIDRLKNCSDPSILYHERLTELMKNPKSDASQLGLFRIAYEGKFKLDYLYKDNVLSIIAERIL